MSQQQAKKVRLNSVNVSFTVTFPVDEETGMVIIDRNTYMRKDLFEKMMGDWLQGKTDISFSRRYIQVTKAENNLDNK